jgi:hypothetical protein
VGVAQPVSRDAGLEGAVSAEELPNPLWGPYLSERAWGTVREDYSPNGNAWWDFPHDEARWRAFRWSEDGLAGLCDVEQRLCLALALWNGTDPILKERPFGLVNDEGNHGEDVKEYYWYVDALPDQTWLRWRYHYPHAAFPYQRLIDENKTRREKAQGGWQPEYELLDTGVFDEGYWICEVTYAQVGVDDIVMQIAVTNQSDRQAHLHVLPTLWFRNTWSWDVPAPAKPDIRLAKHGVIAEHSTLGEYALEPVDARSEPQPTWLFCDNETNAAWPGQPMSEFPKDAIEVHVRSKGSTAKNPENRGTKAAAWYQLDLAGGKTAAISVRLRALTDGEPEATEVDVQQLLHERQAQADEFYRRLTPTDADGEEAGILRQAFASTIWSKQYYGYDVERWLDGDAPAQPAPPDGHRNGRNSDWSHLVARDVIAMPDVWEYPWFAAWDLAFHAVVLAHIDARFAKQQLLLLCQPNYQHPDGRLPAYEWNFSDSNPPVHAWAALKVWAIDGGQDRAFLEEIFHRLEANFSAWLKREDGDGNNIFSGGFLGLDNISVVDRSHLPPGTTLEQSDATGWMAFYALTMAAIADRLARQDASHEADVIEYLDRFAAIAHAFELTGLWDEHAAFYYDRLRLPDQSTILLEVRSMVGLIPLLATARIDPGIAAKAVAHGGEFAQLGTQAVGRRMDTPAGTFVSVVEPAKLQKMLADVFDEDSFLAPFGLRSLSARLRDNPYKIDIPEGGTSKEHSIAYEPAEATELNRNSNWRGPVWLPLNYLLIDAIARIGGELGEQAPSLPYPTGSGTTKTPSEISADLRARIISLWRGQHGRRPIFGDVPRLQEDPAWRENLLFFEYFHGDNGAGLGAMHQTGWTALVADLITGRRLSPDPLGALHVAP